MFTKKLLNNSAMSFSCVKSPVIVSDSRGESLTFGFSVNKSTNKFPSLLKVARYSFPGPIPPKFEHKTRHHKQSFGKIATTVVLDKDENLL